ncbi:hypothetical protein [Enterococcus sp. DIV2359]|uniref:hypothetical protein n=1 Tax=Enterococcus sp. DIV2359 TaxID=2774995 RepID=UPI001AC93A27|nr:hypothetical protein [Enterococcus sp. DIV1271a]
MKHPILRVSDEIVVEMLVALLHTPSAANCIGHALLDTFMIRIRELATTFLRYFSN